MNETTVTGDRARLPLTSSVLARVVLLVALILLVSLLLGPGLRMSVTLIVYGAIWPVLYNTIADADPLAKEPNRAFGFSGLATVRMVSLPSAAPFIATGIRLASAVAIILDIAAGYITGPINGPGIGAYIAHGDCPWPLPRRHRLPQPAAAVRPRAARRHDGARLHRAVQDRHRPVVDDRAARHPRLPAQRAARRGGATCTSWHTDKGQD
jgi:hypothetical protein